MAEPRREFERELGAIEAKVIELFAMVAEDLPGATQALLTGQSEVIKALTEREEAIDALYPEIEAMANREILLQAPVASDLRFLLSVLRIVPELERSHDLVMQIAGRANHILSGDLSPRCRGLVERMGNLASGMWRQAVDSWYERDRSAAAKISERDDEMDELYASLIAELASGGMPLPVTMEMVLVARFYERLGDHAVNIAQCTLRLLDVPATLTPGLEIDEMARRARQMLGDAIDAFIRADGTMGRDVCQRDDEVDALEETTFRVLLTHMMEDPHIIGTAMELFLVSRNLERVADLATNIAEDVVFLVEGKSIKHHAEG